MNKKITHNTLLKQGDIIYKCFSWTINGIWVWCKTNEEFGSTAFENIPVAQSSYVFENIPVVNPNLYEAQKLSKLADQYFHEHDNGFLAFTPVTDAFIDGYHSNPKQYTQKDIELAFGLGASNNAIGTPSLKEVLEQINSISMIEVDSDFKIISYE